MVDGRDHWYHELMAEASTDVRPNRWMPSICCSCCTPRARPASPRASCTPPAATSPMSRTPTSTCSTSTPTTDVYWCTADVGWITGHSYIVYGPARQRCDPGHVRRGAELPGQRPVLGDRREVRRHDPVHGPDGDPHVHEMGRRGAGQTRSVVAAPARFGRRADQPRSVDVVPRAHRRRSVPRSSTRGGRPRPAAS